MIIMPNLMENFVLVIMAIKLGLKVRVMGNLVRKEYSEET